MRLLAAAALALAFLAATPPGPDFRDIAKEAGLTDSFPNGGDKTKQYIIETTGSGVAFLDYDNDGYLDIFVLSGDGGTNRMYHNDHNGHFTDVTAALGLTSSGWAEGVCAGDYDNDGYTDLFVTYWGQNRLYRNIGGKRFEDVTEKAHLTQDRTRYNTGCAFLDYDGDGHLDLFVANYLKFDFATTPKAGANPYCFYRGMAVNCGPRGLPFEANLLYHNKGDGTFEDVSERSGITKATGHYSLAVLAQDVDDDGRPDIYVVGDQTPASLFINQGDGTFSEEAVLRGVALDENGRELSGMGLTSADYDGNGFLSIFRSDFSDERKLLYRNAGKGQFDDVTMAAGLAGNTQFVSWGCAFFDFDNDGWKDLVIVNGHVYPEVDRLHIDIHSRERAILYHNTGKGTFDDISEAAGPAVLAPHSARGLAVGDIDNDGTLEVLVNNQNEPPSLWKQTRRAPGHWLLLKLIGTKSNRSAIGARVVVTAAGHKQTDEVRSGGSYLSQNDLRLHFGLGDATHADSIEVRWPSGQHTVLKDVAADRIVTITE
ncbi:MAG: CRTAC1 family protein [Bryobacteraceae bacterium]